MTARIGVTRVLYGDAEGHWAILESPHSQGLPSNVQASDASGSPCVLACMGEIIEVLGDLKRRGYNQTQIADAIGARQNRVSMFAAGTAEPVGDVLSRLVALRFEAAP